MGMERDKSEEASQDQNIVQYEGDILAIGTLLLCGITWGTLLFFICGSYITTLNSLAVLMKYEYMMMVYTLHVPKAGHKYKNITKHLLWLKKPLFHYDLWQNLKRQLCDWV